MKQTDKQDQAIPVTPFEHYMWVDDSTSYPMVFYLKTRHTDPLDLGRLTSAIGEALKAIPLLASVIDGRKTQLSAALRWKPLPLEKVLGDVLHATTEPFEHPNLNVQSGLRVFFDPDRRELYWQFHHATVDAKGGLSFIKAVMAFYCLTPSAAPAIDNNWSTLRMKPFQLPRFEKTMRLTKDLTRIINFQTQSFFPVRKVAGAAALREPPRSLPALNHLRREFSLPEFQNWLEVARCHQVSFNDLVLTAFFCGYYRWAESNRGSGNLRIAMPIDMRGPMGAKGEVPANLVSMCFLDRPRDQCLDPLMLLHDIHQETAQIKKDDMGIALYRVVGRLGKTPYGLGGFLREKTPFSSVVLSNLGRVSAEIPGIERLELLPPIRYGNQLSIGVVTLDNRVVLTGHFDPSGLSLGDVGSLLDATVAVWA